MKKVPFILSLAVILFACDSNKTSNEERGKEVDPHQNIGVDNVNGNIPDTTNTINLSTNKVDSSAVPMDTPSRK